MAESKGDERHDYEADFAAASAEATDLAKVRASVSGGRGRTVRVTPALPPLRHRRATWRKPWSGF